jgi:RNA polymerase sigma-B factor
VARELFAALAALPPDDPRREPVRQRLIELHLPMVRYFAYRYANRGEPTEDLVQVGTVGLVKAVDRFDPGRGVEFATFAGPTILGEIRRHFRDYTWSVRVERGLRDLAVSASRCLSELTQELGRSPTMRELADRLQQPQNRVVAAIDCLGCRSTESLEAPSPSGHPLSERVGADDSALERVELHEALIPLLARLPVREQRILQLRFFGEMTQTQIAERLGISQMQVSRLLAATLRTLRGQLLSES